MRHFKGGAMLTLNDLKILKDCFLFEHFQNNELFKLNDFLKKENCIVAQYEKDEYVFSDDSTYQLGILLVGKATAVCSEDNKSELKTFSQGEMFGAAGVFSKGQKTSLPKIKADNVCRILFIGRFALEKLIKSNPQIAIKYIEFLSNRVEFLNNRIATFTSSQAVKRLAKYILDNAESNLVDVNFAALARSLDISRASFYRAKNKLEESGAARLDSKKIVALNADILKSYSE